MDIFVTIPVDLDELARGVVDRLNHADLINLILTMDLYAADYEFTTELRDRLTEAIELEDEGIDE